VEAAAEAAAAEIAAAPWVATAKMAGEGATEEPMAVAATRGGEADVVVALDSTAAAAEVEEQAPCWADTAEAVVAAPAPSPVGVVGGQAVRVVGSGGHESRRQIGPRRRSPPRAHTAPRVSPRRTAPAMELGMRFGCVDVALAALIAL